MNTADCHTALCHIQQYTITTVQSDRFRYHMRLPISEQYELILVLSHTMSELSCVLLIGSCLYLTPLFTVNP